MAGFDYDNEDLQRYLKKLEVDQANRQAQGMDAAAEHPAADPYREPPKTGGGWTKILSPLMSLAGMGLSAVGLPEVGVPLSIGGGAVGGASGGGGITGALGGGVKSGVGQMGSTGMGNLFGTPSYTGYGPEGDPYTVPASTASSGFGGS